MRLALAVVLVLVLASPAVADIFAFSWTSTTTSTPPNGRGPTSGGTVSGQDPAATWDRDSSTLRWTVDGRDFGGTLVRSGENDWNTVMDVPSHADYVSATGHNGSWLLTLHETADGFTITGGGGSMGNGVRFSGTGTRRVTAAEPGDGLFLLATLGLAGAIVFRRQRSVVRRRSP